MSEIHAVLSLLTLVLTEEDDLLLQPFPSITLVTVLCTMGQSFLITTVMVALHEGICGGRNSKPCKRHSKAC